MALIFNLRAGESIKSRAYPLVSITRISSLVRHSKRSPVRTHSPSSTSSNFPPTKRTPRFLSCCAGTIRNPGLPSPVSANIPLGITKPMLPHTSRYIMGPRPSHPGVPTLGPLMLTDSLAMTDLSIMRKSFTSVEIPSADPVS